MREEYRYYTQNGTKQRLCVVRDTDPLNPRTEDEGNVGMMCCFGRYSYLGDDTPYRTVEDLKQDLMKTAGITMETLREYAKTDAKTVRLTYESAKHMWQLYSWTKNETESLLLEDDDIEILDDDLLEGVLVSEIIALSKGAVIALPLYVYDHGGITMNTNGFSDPWDTSSVGIIWTTPKKLQETGIVQETGETWESVAKRSLEAEVQTYDQYLKDEVYGYVVETLDEEGEWTEVDSCYGYYVSTSNPLLELADEYFGVGNHTNEPIVAA